MSDYLIQVVHKVDGTVAAWAPGLDIEADVVDELVERVRLKGVGIGRTQDHVLDDVRAAMLELLYDLKARV
jgi:hypothetical protein